MFGFFGPQRSNTRSLLYSFQEVFRFFRPQLTTPDHCPTLSKKCLGSLDRNVPTPDYCSTLSKKCLDPSFDYTQLQTPNHYPTRSKKRFRSFFGLHTTSKAKSLPYSFKEVDRFFFGTTHLTPNTRSLPYSLLSPRSVYIHYPILFFLRSVHVLLLTTHSSEHQITNLLFSKKCLDSSLDHTPNSRRSLALLCS